MKILLLVAVLAAGAWWLHGWMDRQKAAAQAKSANEAVRYAQSLHNDEVRAQAVVDKYNQSVKQSQNAAHEPSETGQ
jgi:hypothetical protein